MITIDKLSCSFTFSICTSGKNLHVDTRGFHLLQTKIIAVVGEEKDKVGSLGIEDACHDTQILL